MHYRGAILALVVISSFWQLGACRELVFTEISNGAHVHTVALTPGSLFILGPLANSLYVHTVPVSRVPCGERISVIFRSAATFKTSTQMKALMRIHAKTQAKNAVKPPKEKENKVGKAKKRKERKKKEEKRMKKREEEEENGEEAACKSDRKKESNKGTTGRKRGAKEEGAIGDQVSQVKKKARMSAATNCSGVGGALEA